LREIRTVCHRDCPDTCFINAYVEGNKIISTKGSTANPVTQGFTCPRGVGDPKRVYSKDRVLYPHIKSNGNCECGFKRVSWDEATQLVAEKLQDVISEYGKDSVLLYDYPGNQGFLAWQYPRRLWFALGATTTDYALCSNSGHEGIGLHYGLSYGLQPEDVLNMGVITFWGNNAKVSFPHQWVLTMRAKKSRGSTIVSIDSRKSQTAEAADIWLNPRPGSDVALAYGVARYLIQNYGVNKDFIQEWTQGYEQYEEEALRWTPELVEQTTGLAWKQVEELGEIYIEKKPAAFMIGIGLQKSYHGAEAVRAVSLMPALLGYHRGFHYSDSNGRNIDLGYLNGSSLTKMEARIVKQVAIGPRLKSGEFKFIFTLGTNPAVTLPNQKAVRAGLAREDVFVVVQDTHWTETTEYADVVLPAATYLEKTDINFSDHHLYSRLSEKAVEPLGESKNEIWVMQELARKLGRKEEWLFEDPWNALEKALREAFVDGTIQNLLEGAVLKLRMRPMDEYQTPSGKIEFYSSKAKELGVTPLPSQLPQKVAEGWFILLNSSTPNYTHSQFRDVYGPIPHIVWMNPKDASELNIENGEDVTLFNNLGKVTVQGVVTDKVPRGVLWSPRPLTDSDGNTMNVLAPSTSQKIGGGPIFNSIKVKIKRI
jgi:anaerobic selenocysteine-containing dehydrogenase